MTEILMRGASDESIILAVLEVWKQEFPEDVRDFCTATKEFRKSLRKENGMAASLVPFGGDSAVLGHVPMKVYKGIEVMIPEFWGQKDADEIFFRVFTKAGIRGA